MLSDTVSSIDQLPTPALVLHAEIVRKNVRMLAEYSQRVGIAVRPHTKTHKSRFLACLQVQAGAIGITAAKIGEAATLSDSGSDVLLAYPPVGPTRAQAFATLARDRIMRAAVDSLAAVKEVSAACVAQGATAGLLVDIDVGMGRTGVQTPLAALKLAQEIERAPGVRLDGVMIYPGHVWELADRQQAALLAVNEIVDETLSLWREHGIAASIVSGGSTPTAYQSHFVSHLTEIRPGTYIFNDMNTVRGGYCSLDDCAARIVTTVVSDAVPGQVVIDAGSKTLTNDICIPARDSGHGHIVEYPDARISKLSEEHAQVDFADAATKPSIGDRITVIPNHICPCVNLQDSVWWAEHGEPLQRLHVDARGKIQ